MKSNSQKIISFLMAIVVLLGLVLPCTAFAVETETSGTTDNQDVGSATFSSTQAPEDYVPQTSTENQAPTLNAQAAADAEDLPKVLLIQDVLPWSSTANQDVLSNITEYDVTTTTDFLDVELEEYGVVVFANDQPFDTYENYEEFKEYLELFASLGGVIVFGACDAGWAGGDLNEMLPGDVSKKTHYVLENYVADSSHLIVTGALTDNVALTDEDLVGSYCSHVSFDEESLPAGSKIILRESDTDRPTLVEYPLGDGRVIASGLTWEFTYIKAGQEGSYGPIGYFAQRAMEDMFRYAIRVSSIDVEELHVLEEWRVAKKAHTIVVADASGDQNNLTPIAGAKVTIDGTEYITNEDGVVTTTDYGEKTVSVSAEGYRDCSEYYELSEETSRIIILERDKNDGLPYITLCTAAKNGKAPYLDLRSQALHFTEGKGEMLILWLQGNWNGHGEGTFNVYQESVNGNPGQMFEIPVGNYLNIAPGKMFERNAQIKVQMVAADGTKSEIIDLNIEIDKAPPEPGETSDTALKEGVTTMDWLGKYPIASDNEVFTKLLTTDMSFAGDLIPVEIAKEHNEDGTITYKGIIGALANEDSKELLDGDDNDEFEMESAWDEFKDQIENYKNAKNPKQYFKNLKNNYKKLLVPSKLETGFGDPELDVCGYLEVTVNCNNEVISSDGGMIVTGAANYSIGKTFMAGPVPLYFEFAPGVEIEVNTGVNVYNEDDALTFKPFFKGTKVAIPSISLEGGVGVRNVATAGLNGTGKLLVTFPGTDDPNFNVDLSLDGSVHIKVLFVADYIWSFASTQIHFYPKAKAAAQLSAALENVEPELSLASRDYLEDTTEWNGAPAAVLSEDSTDTVAVLQEGVMPEAMPQIHQVGDQQIMLFLRDVEGRTIGNHTQLVYSVCQDGVWSDPQPVWESETADFFFSSAVADDKLMVAWQKSSDVAASENAEELLTEIAANSEICFASWDAETCSFINQMYVTDNDLLDMMPAVATDGENITVTWVRNDANNVLGTDGSYEIYQASITADGAQPEQMLYTTEDYVVEIAAGMNESGTQLIFAAMNESDTVDLYSISGGAATKLVSGENPAGLSYADGMFLWQEDGSIFSYIPGASEAKALVSSDVANVSSSYEYVSNGTGASLVWTDTNENGYQVKATIRMGDTWTTPVALVSGNDDTVPFMDAVLLDNGNYAIILNTACYNAEQNVDQTALAYANVVPKTSVSLELAQLNYPDWENGTQAIDIALENSGTVPVYSAAMTVTCENGTVLDKTLDLELMPGESVIISEVLDIQSVNQEMTGTVNIQVANDIDSGDNTMTVTLGQVDASLNLDVYERGDEFLFVLTASNNSYTDANAAISIIEDSPDGVVLNMKNIGVVTNAENVQYLFTIDRSKVDFAGKEFKTYFFSLTTQETDWYGSNNILTYTIKGDAGVSVTDIEVTGDKSDIRVGETAVYTAKIVPENATNQMVEWIVSDESLVSMAISEDTKTLTLTGVSEGTVEVVARTADGGYSSVPLKLEIHANMTAGTATRIAGSDRIETSLKIANQLKETLGVDKFETVIVASALNFPDALTGSYLAAVKSAPILLTYEAAHAKVTEYIQENLASGGTVYILGGESAVSAGFQADLAAKGISVKRLAGTDRFGTNLEIMKEAGADTNTEQSVLIATALNFADSLSASAAGLPMILVHGSLREDQKEFLATTSKNFIIIGGEAAVSASLESELKAIGTVDRLAGNGRYETSVLVAERFVPDPDAVVLAYARNFPDGLCAGPLAVALNAPLVLTDNYDPSAADTYVKDINTGFVVGGPSLISDVAVRAIFDLTADTPVTAE